MGEYALRPERLLTCLIFLLIRPIIAFIVELNVSDIKFKPFFYLQPLITNGSVPVQTIEYLLE